jgi:hypothetical protein
MHFLGIDGELFNIYTSVLIHINFSSLALCQAVRRPLAVDVNAKLVGIQRGDNMLA